MLSIPTPHYRRLSHSCVCHTNVGRRYRFLTIICSSQQIQKPTARICGECLHDISVRVSQPCAFHAFLSGFRGEILVSTLARQKNYRRRLDLLDRLGRSSISLPSHLLITLSTTKLNPRVRAAAKRTVNDTTTHNEGSRKLISPRYHGFCCKNESVRTRPWVQSYCTRCNVCHFQSADTPPLHSPPPAPPETAYCGLRRAMRCYQYSTRGEPIVTKTFGGVSFSAQRLSVRRMVFIDFARGKMFLWRRFRLALVMIVAACVSL